MNSNPTPNWNPFLLQSPCLMTSSAPKLSSTLTIGKRYVTLTSMPTEGHFHNAENVSPMSSIHVSCNVHNLTIL